MARARVEIIAATLWADGTCYSVTGVGDGARAVVAIGTCAVPRGVGARSGGKLARVAKKIARSKALKQIARAALQKAGRMNPLQAESAILVAKTAINAATRLDAEVLDEQDDEQQDADNDIETEVVEW